MKSRCVNIAVIVLSFPYLCAQAQDTLTVERNAVRTGDRVTSQAVGISNVGDGGKGIVWDFSEIDVYDDMRTYVYAGENEDSVIRVSRKSAETYVISRDSLLMISKEDRLRRADFDIPLLRMSYPLAYGDSVNAPFSARGTYCDRRYFTITGQTTTKADGWGRLLLPDGSKFDNVLRVRFLRHADLSMSRDTTVAGMGDKRHITELTYEWYVPGYRYPLLEIMERVSFDEQGERIASASEAWMTTPGGIDATGDILNETIRANGTYEEYSEQTDEQKCCGLLADYVISVNGNTVIADYTLTSDADITFLVSDASGVIYKHSAYNGVKAGAHTETIDCSGLRKGQYILYINVSGRPYANKFALK